MTWLFMGLHLIMLHGPNGQTISVNVDEISSIRTPQARHHFPHFPPGTHCVITMANRNFNAVAESCERVHALLKGAI